MEQYNVQPKDKKTKFTNEVLDRVKLLSCTGQLYRRKVHKLDNIIKTYIHNMSQINSSLGQSYLDKMSKDVLDIFSNLHYNTPYDNIEFINSVINYYFKLLAFQYNLTKRNPQLPDYTLAEIKEMAKNK